MQPYKQCRTVCSCYKAQAIKQQVHCTGPDWCFPALCTSASSERLQWHSYMHGLTKEKLRRKKQRRMVATKDKFIKGQKQGKDGRKELPRQRVKEDNRGWKKATGPLTITFLLLSSPPSSQTPKMRIYTLKQVISIRNTSVTQSKLTSYKYNSDTLSPLSIQNSPVKQFVFNS